LMIISEQPMIDLWNIEKELLQREVVPDPNRRG